MADLRSISVSTEIFRMKIEAPIMISPTARSMWFQLYASETEDGNSELVETAVAAVCRAVALTVDAPFEMTVEPARPPLQLS